MHSDTPHTNGLHEPQTINDGDLADASSTNNGNDTWMLSRDLDNAEASVLGVVSAFGLDTERVCKHGGPDAEILNVGARPKIGRLQQAIHELARDEQRLLPDITDADAVRRGRQRLERSLRPHLLRTAEAYADTEPSHLAPRRDGEHDEVMAGAMLDACPGLRYAVRDLTTHDDYAPRRGPKAKRAKPVVTVVLIALSMLRPNFEDVYLLFSKMPLLRHLFGHPTGPADNTAALKQMHQVLAYKDSDYLQHLQVEQFRRVCELRDDNGELKYPRAGEVVLVDGTLMEADIEQRNPRDDADAAVMRGHRFHDTGFVIYTSKRSAKQDQNSDNKTGGGVLTRCHGWKMLGLIDQDTGMVMIADKYPANCNERDAALELIRKFFKHWPGCDRFEYLVGDSLYDHSKQFAATLWFGCSIHPVFPEHGVYDKTLAYVEGNQQKPGILGVPCCPIHRNNEDGTLRPMKFKDATNLVGIEQRKTLGLGRDQWVDDLSARNRWKCAVAGCDKVASTLFRDDPRVYTYLHRAGQHKRKTKRDVLLARRNRVEGFFSTLKNSGLGARGSLRARWAGDIEMRWLFLFAACGHNARILADLTGAYSRALAEAESLGLIESTADTSAAAQQAASEDRRLHTELPRAPRTWKRPTLDRSEDQLAEMKRATEERKANTAKLKRAA